MRVTIAAAMVVSALSGAAEVRVKPFQDRLDEYVKLRKSATENLPALKKNATPEEIRTRELALAAAIRKARAGAQPGEILAPDVKPVFRGILKSTMTGAKKEKLRAAVKEGNPKHELAAGEIEPLIAVNAIYPTNAPLSTVPPSLLLRLPKLPKELEYRFVGRTLILLDREANLIIDFIKEAVPAA